VPEAPDDEAPAALPALDKLFEHRVRLAIAALLARRDALSFSRLKELLGETDGSLGAHLRRLEEAGYVTFEKEFVARKPVTWYRLAPVGRRALVRHVGGLERLLSGISSDPSSSPSKPARKGKEKP
jgi:DNA-binding transcriptional ArsR family regulator